MKLTCPSPAVTDSVPVNEPLLGGNEALYLQECISTGWISSEGPFVERFESGMAERVGRRYGIALCNGTAALEVAVAALGLGPGDEVILPTFTIISCAAAVIRAGATPVLVDADPATWNMDVAQIDSYVTARTRAIMAVHVYGLPVEMAPLTAVAERHGLAVIEDAAEAIGQTCDGKPCGSFGVLSVLSFYPNKHVTTGEGGMVLTDDPVLADRCRSLRNLCFQPARRFVHEDLGWNYRMSNLQAAVGVAQLERLDDHLERKRRIGAVYDRALTDLSGLQRPMREMEYARNLYWVYGLVLEDDVPFDGPEAMRRLGVLGIGTRPFFWPMHEQPVFEREGLFAGVRHPVAERLARRGFYVPSGLALTGNQQDRVCDALRGLLS
jgi:perosamine synthetase